MESIDKVGLAGVTTLQGKATDQKKYLMIFDKTGNAATFFQYKATLLDWHKHVIKHQMGNCSKEDSLHEFRKMYVGGMKTGGCLVVNVDKIRPEFSHAENQWGGTDIIPDVLFDYNAFLDHDTYMKIVPDEENISLTGDQGNFFRQPGFAMFILCQYKDDEDMNSYHEKFPHGAQFKKVIIE